ncbi:uncharacterized protein BP5553_02008 [Venustampulla echinocandica]|uniref:Copper-fist domain-containing protein n=1 Tax=Venustampulla echinocandica TaxID=2656787 RepID=A0A370U2M4_9HELO|nr:uncharacterized protein BP5553_02008 [Venustampulla echinocandica]RDL42029.1 hypothetical protein BP5553_02008 [Venustampulla echinocandica]
MPLINGMKMACEPCIRGHRSTKCTHANERLMVPVRKPGRPLSQCPHPGGQSCGCGSVTAAIPRKQTCHCGGDGSRPAQAQTQAPVPAPQIVPRSSSQGASDASSPTKPTFKVQKASRPPSASRKQSFDPSNFGRIDMNSVNIVPFKPRSQSIPIPVTPVEGYTMAGPPQTYGYNTQYANIQPQLSHATMQPPPSPYDGEDPLMRANGFTNGFTNGVLHHEKPYVVESPLATPSIYGNGNSSIAMNGGSCCTPPTPLNHTNGESKAYKNGSSCCAPKQNGHNRTSSLSSVIPEQQEPRQGSCCSSKPPHTLKQEPASNNGTPIPTHVPSSPQMLAQGNMPFSPALYQQLVSSQPTVFTYPPTYGSFQNPLQPSAWRQSIQDNMYSQPQPQAQIPPPSAQLPFDAPLVPETMNTIHTCSCGDGCQCIGCAAHPYNNATQDYVRSAWAMSAEQYTAEMYSNGQPTSAPEPHGNANGNGSVPPQGADPMASPTPLTPSSTSSGNGEEQSLSAADFFFVNYPFSSEGCGGDTLSCPCGDDCQCLGCTIHRQPAIPCGGERESCPCGDNCECIGCSIHNGGVTT